MRFVHMDFYWLMIAPNVPGFQLTFAETPRWGVSVMPCMLILFQRNTDMFNRAQVKNLSENDNLISLVAPHLYQTTQILHQSFYEKS
jgi:hypothetical protein